MSSAGKTGHWAEIQLSGNEAPDGNISMATAAQMTAFVETKPKEKILCLSTELWPITAKQLKRGALASEVINSKFKYRKRNCLTCYRINYQCSIAEQTHQGTFCRSRQMPSFGSWLRKREHQPSILSQVRRECASGRSRPTFFWAR